MRLDLALTVSLASFVALPAFAQTAASAGPGADQAIGQRFEVKLDPLPKPFEGPIVRNPPLTIDRENRIPAVPDNFEISLFAEKLDNPRQALVLPNGDLAVVSQS
jgi:glucose/arabinose dehydrogenase